MADSDKIPQIDPTEIEILIQKIEQSKLDERERRLIVALLRTFQYIVAQLQEKKITLLKIKDMIFGRKSEQHDTIAGGHAESIRSMGNAFRNHGRRMPGGQTIGAVEGFRKSV